MNTKMLSITGSHISPLNHKNSTPLHIIILIIYMIIILMEMALLSDMDGDSLKNYLITSSWLIVFNFSVQTYLIYKTQGVVTFLYTFVAFYYIFHFGQVIMLGIFPWYEYNYVDYISTYMVRNPLLAKETIKICINCINIFVFGALVCSSPQIRINHREVIQYNYREICKIVFFFLFSFRVLLDIIALYVTSISGYSGTFESFLPGVFSALGVIGYSVIPLYYYSINDPKKKRNFLIFILLYLTITMLSGNRAFQVVCIVGLLLVYLIQNRMSLKNVAILAVLIVAGLSFIDFIYDIRGIGFNSYLKSGSGVTNSGEVKNILLETLGTFGETIYTPFLVLENYKAVSPYWGECFVKSLVSIVPDVTGAFKNINNEAVFAKMVSSGHTIGGSFAGEMYYNFGNTYLAPSCILGYLYSRLSRKVVYSIKTHHLESIYMSLPVCVLFVWWIRDSIGNMTREIVWLWLLFYLIKYIVGHKRYV